MILLLHLLLAQRHDPNLIQLPHTRAVPPCHTPTAADEWEQSIKDSHPCSDETEAALATHRQEIKRIEAALQRYSQPLQQLLSAAQTLQQSTDGAARSGPLPDERQVHEAVEVLRQAAAHVKWF